MQTRSCAKLSVYILNSFLDPLNCLLFKFTVGCKPKLNSWSPIHRTSQGLVTCYILASSPALVAYCGLSLTLIENSELRSLVTAMDATREEIQDSLDAVSPIQNTASNDAPNDTFRSFLHALLSPRERQHYVAWSNC